MPGGEPEEGGSALGGGPERHGQEGRPRGQTPGPQYRAHYQERERRLEPGQWPAPGSRSVGVVLARTLCTATPQTTLSG